MNMEYIKLPERKLITCVDGEAHNFLCGNHRYFKIQTRNSTYSNPIALPSKISRFCRKSLPQYGAELHSSDFLPSSFWFNAYHRWWLNHYTRFSVERVVYRQQDTIYFPDILTSMLLCLEGNQSEMSRTIWEATFRVNQTCWTEKASF